MDTLEEILGHFDSADKFSEHEVSAETKKLQKKLKEEEKDVPLEVQYESMAFDFYESGVPNKDWGTYYHPMAVFPGKDGKMYETPSLSLVTPEMLEYWMQRSRDAKHPTLCNRYAGLVWDFSKSVTQKGGPIDMARIIIDSAVALVDSSRYSHPIDMFHKLKRAISIAIGIKDEFRINAVRDAIIILEYKVADDTKPGLWVQTYDLLVENKGINLPPEIEHKVIKVLDERLERLTANPEDKEFNPHAAESAATRLAQYYRGSGKDEEAKRVLIKYGNAFLILAQKANGMVASAWLQKVHSIYSQYGLKKEAESILALLPQYGKKANEEMKTFTHEFSISKHDLQGYINAMTDGNLEQVFNRIAYKYTPDKSKTKEQVIDLSSKYVLRYLFPTSILDEKGQTIATIGPLQDDPEGHIVQQMSENLSYAVPFLREVINATINKFNLTSDMIVDELFKSPIFQGDRRTLFVDGLKSFLEKDHVTFVHLVIPQIEFALRSIVELGGGAIYRPNDYGGLHLKMLGAILQDDIVINALGEDACLYLRVLLTDSKGWNIRNSVCHGTCSSDSFSFQIADRLFHVLLLLAQLRINEEE